VVSDISKESDAFIFNGQALQEDFFFGSLILED
jgi:hypothetical protein